MKHKIANILTVLSFFLLYPGVTLPIFTLNMSGAIDSSLANLNLEMLDQTRSILQTVKDLYKSDDFLVAFLILFFSLVVPLLKAVLVLLTLNLKKFPQRKKIYKFVRRIAKWSMADVFVVAIFLAYLSTVNQMVPSFHQVDLLGMRVDFKSVVFLKSSLGSGFYYFLGYCLCSLIALEFYCLELYKDKK